jgi:transposase
MSEADTDNLVAIIKQDFNSRRMRLIEIQQAAGLGHVSTCTVWSALHKRGIKAYVEEFKFILTGENKEVRLKWCEKRKDWTLPLLPELPPPTTASTSTTSDSRGNWGDYGFTDEMSIEVGGTFGEMFVWREKGERWADNCVGAAKKQGSKVMCWGMIKWGYKGPFHVWEAETDEERAASIVEIDKLNSEMEEETERLNQQWKGSEEWKALKKRELEETRIQRAAEKAGAPKRVVEQTYRRKKFTYDKIVRGEKRGVDAYRYVKHVARPLLWPACRELLRENPNFVLMEDGASCHSAGYTTRERKKEGIDKVDWPANSPDFNPIERIWTLMKRRIQRRRGSERVTTTSRMKAILIEEWDKITIEEINNEIIKLPIIMQRCIDLKGGNKYHA